MRGFRFVPLILALAAFGCRGTSTSGEQERSEALDDFRWRHRIILIQSATEDVAALEKQLAASQSEIADRDVLWFVLAEGDLRSNHRRPPSADLTDEVGRLLGDDDAMVLIGKDGGVKLRSPEIDLERALALIDTMPMRRAESREAEGR